MVVASAVGEVVTGLMSMRLMQIEGGRTGVRRAAEFRGIHPRHSSGLSTHSREINNIYLIYKLDFDNWCRVTPEAIGPVMLDGYTT
jgi:hypothetical protein